MSLNKPPHSDSDAEEEGEGKPGVRSVLQHRKLVLWESVFVGAHVTIQLEGQSNLQFLKRGTRAANGERREKRPTMAPTQ